MLPKRGAGDSFEFPTIGRGHKGEGATSGCADFDEESRKNMEDAITCW